MKTNFSPNTPVTASWFNSMNAIRLRFNGDPNNPSGLEDGQYLPLEDSDLSNAPGSIKNRVATLTNSGSVVANGGLSVLCNGGKLRTSVGTVFDIVQTSLNLPASSTSYLYIDDNGGIVSTSSFSVSMPHAPLARVVTNASTVLSVTDLRPSFISLKNSLINCVGRNISVSPFTYSTLNNTVTFSGGTITVPSNVSGNVWLDTASNSLSLLDPSVTDISRSTGGMLICTYTTDATKVVSFVTSDLKDSPRGDSKAFIPLKLSNTQVQITGGILQASSGLVYVPTGTITISSNVLICANLAGQFITTFNTTVVPTGCVPVARVLFSNGQITSVQSALPKASIPADLSGLKQKGFISTTGDLIVTANMTLYGDFFCQNLVVQAGKVLTLNGTIYCSGNAQIDGTVNSEFYGTSRGMMQYGTIITRFSMNRSEQFQGDGQGGGFSGTNLTFVTLGSVCNDTHGSGGGSGHTFTHFTDGGTLQDLVIIQQSPWGGRGGGSISIKANGTITISSTGRIFCDGEKGEDAARANWNEEGDRFVGYDNDGSGTLIKICLGGGGGSGGYVGLYAGVSIVNNGLITANGGAGGLTRNMSNRSFVGGLASGGGGGHVVMCAQSVAQGSIQLNPGVNGGAWYMDSRSKAESIPGTTNWGVYTIGGSFGGISYPRNVQDGAVPQGAGRLTIRGVAYFA